MRIAVTADPYLPVPPTFYGGIERIVDLIVRGLHERGHSVTLFAHPASQTQAALVPYGWPPHTGSARRAAELLALAAGLWNRRRAFDVVLSWGRLAALLPILPVYDLPKVQSYAREVPWRGVAAAVKLGGVSIHFVGCSASLYQPPTRTKQTGHWSTIYYGVDTRAYSFSSNVAPDAPLVFLGRLERIKGVHNAIMIARKAHRRLIIAGNQVLTGPDAGYFDREIAPHIDGEQVRYVGPVDDAQKSEILRTAAALLMPIEWEEPFGIVMAEAMACGTPVIGYPRGSVPEVVHDRLTGYLVSSVEEAAQAVAALPDLERGTVRADCEARFSATALVDAYEQLCVSLVRSPQALRS